MGAGTKCVLLTLNYQDIVILILQKMVKMSVGICVGLDVPSNLCG